MYELHIANMNYSSWSLRPWVLLRELDIPFIEHQHYFRPANDLSDPFNRFSPSGLVPALTDNGVTVWDSLAIAEYVYETHPAVWPEDKGARAFARSVAAEMHSGFTALRSQCGMNCGLRIRLHRMTPELTKDLKRLDALWQEGLERFGGPFLTGDRFTAVDAFFCPVAFRVQTYDLPLSEASKAYVQHLLELKSMQIWYACALREEARDLPHEEDARASGTLLADHRIHR
ncbi:glutathione S-transferase family protein [Asticcacaulis tiandongensis]|uniref:glutathione S-transferase family protein n=1 Tax=Asticcacaulis tiandongensis TaxID=2565365 RepID=UPI00112EDA0C|nr:glutathione S-transferase family protein [Asticcacaulis tiandongensis]